jgi:ABC-type glycerol-3-phosphate transport system substrate-binding protein
MKPMFLAVRLLILGGLFAGLVSCAPATSAPVVVPPTAVVPGEVTAKPAITEALPPTMEPASVPDKNTVLFWSWVEFDSEGEAFNTMVEAFKAANPDVSVDVNLIRRQP